MSLYTKSGFSRNFGCCGHWKSCAMGKGTCIYEDKDPETMKGCSAWRRNQNDVKPIFYEASNPVSNADEEKPKSVGPVPMEQLSLF